MKPSRSSSAAARTSIVFWVGICARVPGPVPAEGVAPEARAMIAEGLKLPKTAPKIPIKVPLPKGGVRWGDLAEVARADDGLMREY